MTISSLSIDPSRLVSQAQSGDPEAFAALVRAHHTAVRAFIGRYVRDAAAVDDLAQEVFVTAHRRLPTFRGDSQLSTWLLGIARNRALTYLRNAARRERREGRPMAACLDQWQAARLEHGEEEAQQEEMLEALRDCLTELTPTCRELVDAFYFQNEQAEAIARRLDRKSSSVRMTLLRIRKTLGACIQRKTGESESS